MTLGLEVFVLLCYNNCLLLQLLLRKGLSLKDLQWYFAQKENIKTFLEKTSVKGVQLQNLH